MPASESEIANIVFKCPNKQSDSDPIPTWLLISPQLSSILFSKNQSSSTSQETYYRQRPNHKLLSNLQSPTSPISKIIKGVKCRLTDHLVYNGLLNPHQSA